MKNATWLFEIISLFSTTACKDLIRRFLTFNREQRITLEECLGHEWLRKGYDGPVTPILFPNYPRDEEMDKNILRHMTDKMEFEEQEIIDAVTQNRFVGVLMSHLKIFEKSLKIIEKK